MEFVDQFQSLPLFTRTWLGLTFAVTAAVTLDAIPVDQIVLDWRRVFNIASVAHNRSYYSGHGRPELWRILTSFCYCGAPLNELYSIFLLYTIYLHSNGYEKNPFPAGSGSRTADTIFSVLFCVVCLLCTHRVPGYLFGPAHELYPILTRNLTGALLYLWSKRNPRAMIQLNFVPIQGQYLPFAHIGLSLFMQNRLHELVHGFAVAHLYYYLVEIAPMVLGGRRILHAPRILAELIGEGGNVIPEQHYHPQAYRDRDGATQAHIAAKLGRLQDLQQLVEATAPNARELRRRLLTASDRNGWQPLHEACRGGSTAIVKYLVVEQGQYVDVRATTNSRQSALSLSQQFHGEEHPVTQLLRQIIDGDADDGEEKEENDESNVDACEDAQ